MASRQNTSDFNEKRKHARIDTSNVVNFFLFDANGKKIGHGKGRTLNLSQQGTLLETNKPLHGSFILLVTIDLEGKKIQVKGRVVNTRKSDKAGFFLTGVEFIGPKDEQLNAIIAFVKTYNHNKSNGR